MKDLKIYTVDAIQEPLLLTLCHDGLGGVRVKAVNTKGKEVDVSRSVTLKSNGTVILHQGVDEDFELPLDDNIVRLIRESFSTR